MTAYCFTRPDEENLSFEVIVVYLGSTFLILFVSLVLNVLSIVCLIAFICMLARSNVNNSVLLKLLPFLGVILVASLVLVILGFYDIQFEGPLFFCVNSLFSCIINPRRAFAARVTVLGLSVSVRLSVCYHVFCHHAQRTGKIATPTGSALHWLDFKNVDFRKSAAFRSYGVKTK